MPVNNLKALASNHFRHCPPYEQGVFILQKAIGIFRKKLENFIVKFSLIGIRYIVAIKN